MISLLCYWLYYAILFFLAGFHFCDWLSRVLGDREQFFSVFQALLTGVALITFLLTLIHFFVPINSTVHLSVAAWIFLTSVVRYRKLQDYFIALFENLLRTPSEVENNADRIQEQSGKWIVCGMVLIFLLGGVWLFGAIPYVNKISLEASVQNPDRVKVYYDVGEGYRESQSVVLTHQQDNVFSGVLFSRKPLDYLRFDIGEPDEIVDIEAIGINGKRFSISRKLPNVTPLQDIKLSSKGEFLLSYVVVGIDPAFTIGLWQGPIFSRAALLRNIVSIVVCFAFCLLLQKNEKFVRLGIYAFFWLKQNRQFLMRAASFLGGMIVLTLYVCSLVQGYPDEYDTDLYHAQTVRWIKEYPTIPGLGNIHLRLAFNNSWFLLASFMDVFHFSGKSYHLVNSFFYLLVGGAIMNYGQVRWEADYKVYNFSALILLLPLVWYTRGINSFSTDVVSNLLIMYLVLESLRLIETANISQKNILILLLLVCFGVSVKLILVPFLIIPFGLLLWMHDTSGTSDHYKKLGFAGMLAMVALMLLIPWIIRGVIQTGYIFWPLPSIDFFSFDWTVPASYVKRELLWIKCWPYGITPDAYLKTGSGTLLIQWLESRWAETALILGLCCLFQFLLWRSSMFTRLIRQQFTGLHLMLLLALAYWLVNAPDLRFGRGILSGLLAMMSATICTVVCQCWDHARKFCGYALVGLAIGICVSRLDEVKHITGPLPGYQEFDMEPFRFPSGLHVLSTRRPDDRCGFAEIPCIPFHYKTFKIEKRGESLTKGFRRVGYRQLPDSL